MSKGRKTGNITEQKACEELIKEGFEVWMPPYPRFGKTGKNRTCDILNVFDILAVNGKVIRFIQVKTASWFSKKVIMKIKKCKLPKSDIIIKEYWALWNNDEFKKRVIE